MNEAPKSWEAIAAGKRAALAASIPAEWRVPDDLLPPSSQADVTGWPETSGWFTAEELAVTNLTASELLPKLASGQLKSVDVTTASCKRAAAAHQLVSHSKSTSRRSRISRSIQVYIRIWIWILLSSTCRMICQLLSNLGPVI